MLTNNIARLFEACVFYRVHENFCQTKAQILKAFYLTVMVKRNCVHMIMGAIKQPHIDGPSERSIPEVVKTVRLVMQFDYKQWNLFLLPLWFGLNSLHQNFAFFMPFTMYFAQKQRTLLTINMSTKTYNHQEPVGWKLWSKSFYLFDFHNIVLF